MGCVLRHRRHNMLNVGRPGEMRKAFKAMADDMVCKGFPAEHWTAAKAKARYHDCRKRWLQWTAVERSGTGADSEGLMQAPKEAFDRLIAKDRSASWLLYEPLKNITTYREVFAKELATGSRIREAGEAPRLPESEPETHEEEVAESPQSVLSEGSTIYGPFRETPPPLREPGTPAGGAADAASSVGSTSSPAAERRKRKRSAAAASDGILVCIFARRRTRW